MEAADIVVVGGGHNGLICAAYLARAGLDVCVLERNDKCGGALFSSDNDGTILEHGGIDHSTIVASPIPDELDLATHGLSYLHRTASAMHVYGDGIQIAIAETAEETARSIAAVDRADGDAWLELVDLSRQLLALTGELSNGRELPMSWLQRAGPVALGRKGQPLIDLATLPVTELATRWFRSPHMRALAIVRSQFSGLPPWYPGTGAVFSLTPGGHGRRFARPQGGSRAFVASLEAAIISNGGRIHTGRSVAAVQRRSRGWEIELADGDRLLATAAVVSALPPQDMVLRLMAAETSIPARLRKRFADVEVVSDNLSQYTLSAALSRVPDLGPIAGTGFEGSQLWFLDDPRDVLSSPEAAAAGTFPSRPGVLATFPSIADPSLAPAGRATMWMNGFVAQEIARRGGWEAEAPDAVKEIWATVEACLPGVRELVTNSVFTSPTDLTARTAALNPGAHVAPTLPQLLGGRPVAGCADHRLIDGIYLTGAGTNPGPGISGMPGRRCAHAVLADLGDASRRRWARGIRQEWDRARALTGMARTIRRG